MLAWGIVHIRALKPPLLNHPVGLFELWRMLHLFEVHC